MLCIWFSKKKFNWTFEPWRIGENIPPWAIFPKKNFCTEQLFTFKIIFLQRSSETKSYSFLYWEHICLTKSCSKNTLSGWKRACGRKNRQKIVLFLELKIGTLDLGSHCLSDFLEFHNNHFLQCASDQIKNLTIIYFH